MRKVVILFVALSFNACKSPGLEEPKILQCSILYEPLVELYQAECFDNEGNFVRTFSIFDMISYICVSPEDYAKVKTHHEILHRELNDKDEK